ncbi:MAG: NAD(P)-binding domain-containing protein [Butyricicoccus sp.]
MFDTVLIAGLGLMGGSMAKTIKARTLSRVLGWNRTRATAEQAWLTARLTRLRPKRCTRRLTLLSLVCTRRQRWTGCSRTCRR